MTDLAQRRTESHRPTALAYSAVIPTKDRPVRAVGAVEGLLSQTRLPERIVVVDASSPPLSLPDLLVRRCVDAGVDVRLEHTTASTALQRNHGIDLVTTAVVLLLDDDVRLEPGYAETLLRRWEEKGLQQVGGMIGSAATIPRQSTAASMLRRLTMLNYIDERHDGTSLRRSGKLRFVYTPRGEVCVPAVGAGATLFRTDLVRRHRFDEHFPGYVLGEDLDLSWRLARDAPIVQLPTARFWHDRDPRERRSSLRWHYRGRREAYFRLRRLGSSPLDALAFAVSVVAETCLALADSVRSGNPRHVAGYVTGVAGALRERHRERRAHRATTRHVRGGSR